MSENEGYTLWVEGLDPYLLGRHNLPIIRKLEDILQSFVLDKEPGDAHEIASSTGPVLLKWLKSYILVVQEIEIKDSTFKRNLFDVLWFILLELNSRCVKIDSSTANYQKRAFGKAVWLLKIYSKSEDLFNKCSIPCHMIWLFNYVLVLLRVPEFFNYFCVKEGLSSIVEITKRLISRTGANVSIPTNDGDVLLLIIEKVTDLNPKTGFNSSVIPLFVDYLNEMSTFLQQACKFCERNRQVVLLMSKVMVKLSLDQNEGKAQLAMLSAGRVLKSYSGIHPEMDAFLPLAIRLCNVMEELYLKEATFFRTVKDYNVVKDYLSLVSDPGSQDDLPMDWSQTEGNDNLRGTEAEAKPMTDAWTSPKVAGVTEVTTISVHSSSEDEDDSEDWSIDEVLSDEGDFHMDTDPRGFYGPSPYSTTPGAREFEPNLLEYV